MALVLYWAGLAGNITVVAAIETCALFSGLDKQALTALERATQCREYSAGQEVFSVGDPGDGLFIVGAGQVEISGQSSDGQCCVLARFGPGDFFGEMALIDGKPRSSTAVAVQPSQLYFIPRDAMVEMLVHKPEVSLRLLWHVTQRFRRFDQQHMQQVLQNERLAVLGQFAQAVLHDLKNPLALIGLTLDSMSDPAATVETRRAAAARIRRQLSRISELVNDVMEFTQPRRAVGDFVPVNYAAFVEQTVADILPEVETGNVKLLMANRPPAVKVAINASRLRRVFFNLIQNAVEAMQTDGRIAIRFGRTEAEVVTEIEDTGPGIPAEIQDRLFEPFVTLGKVHGTGLGLSICKRIIEEHQGRIWGQNLPGHGAVFGFVLPVHK